jgi:hypothetical protein
LLLRKERKEQIAVTAENKINKIKPRTKSLNAKSLDIVKLIK